MLKLNGKWKYILDRESSKSYPEIEKLIKAGTFNGSVSIPNNWQVAGINNFSGTVWFIKTFRSNDASLALSLLKFYGVDYFCEIWLNSKYIGKHEGYFQEFLFDVSALLLHKNILVVKVTSPKEPPEAWPHKKKLIKGIFAHHDCRPGGWSIEHGQDLNTGGIWNRVEIIQSNKILITGTEVKPVLSKDFKFAEIHIKMILRFPVGFKSRKDKVTVNITTPENKTINHYFNLKLSPGKSIYKIKFKLSNPKLWFPWDIGIPVLYSMEVSSVNIERVKINFGIRKVELDRNMNFIINGRKLFLRGTNIIPAQYLSELSNAKIKNLIRLLKKANINIVRVHAHINRRELYDAFDKNGIMVWQDFSLQWTYDDSIEFEKNAVSQISDMVKHLYNHVSIVFWCCHNEPGDQVNILDKKLFARVKKLDNTRIVRIASNYEEHAYKGWYWGKTENYIATPMGPLVTEFGAQALPALDSMKRFIPKDKLFPPDLDLWEFHNFQPNQTFNIAKIKTGNSIETFIENSQDYQYRLLKTAIHFYRRKKNMDITGIFQFMFIDGWPSITWSVIDYYFQKKKGFFALKDAYEPLLLSVYLRQDTYFPGSILNCEIWIINDLYKIYNNLTLKIMLANKIIAEINSIKVSENENVYFSVDELDIKLPRNLPAGKYDVKFLLNDARGKKLGYDEYPVLIRKKQIGELIEE